MYCDLRSLYVLSHTLNLNPKQRLCLTVNNECFSPQDTLGSCHNFHWLKSLWSMPAFFGSMDRDFMASRGVVLVFIVDTPVHIRPVWSLAIFSWVWCCSPMSQKCVHLMFFGAADTNMLYSVAGINAMLYRQRRTLEKQNNQCRSTQSCPRNWCSDKKIIVGIGWSS